jgi:uncharacterized protein
MTATLAVIAKAPVPGRVKTRLCPPCTPVQAARLAEAALRDVVDAMLATPAARRALVLDGRAPAWLPAAFDVVPQRGDGLDERLAHAFADLGRALVVSMDAPQVRPADLRAGLRALDRHGAVLGPAADGGYWAIGLRRPVPSALLGVPMECARTLAAQRRRLDALGLRRAELRELRDVDTWADAIAVAAEAPRTRFAAALSATVERLQHPVGAARHEHAPG